MQVKKVYMDLQEWVKKWNVWKLECDAFKKPIELEIHYDADDLEHIDHDIEWLYDVVNELNWEIKSLKAENEKLKAQQDHLLEWYLNTMNKISDIESKSSNQLELVNTLNKRFWNVENNFEQMTWAILHQDELINEIEKKITKQPMVFNDKSFVSWNESVILNTIDVPAWEYLVISKFIVWEHNEYVDNQDEILFNKVHVENWYDIRYELEWKWTAVDVPTATIFYNLVFIPC